MRNTDPSDPLSTDTLIDLGGRFRLRAIEYRARGQEDKAVSWDRTADRWLRKVLDRLTAQRAIDLSWLRDVTAHHDDGTVEFIPEDDALWGCTYPGPQGDWGAWEAEQLTPIIDARQDGWDEDDPGGLLRHAKDVAAEWRRWAELVERYGAEIWEVM